MAAATAVAGSSCSSTVMLLISSLVKIITLLSLVFCHSTTVTAATEESVEVKGLLKFLNRAGVKSIQTEHGDVFECIDVYKQPAFDHPLLKNHTIQMQPSFDHLMIKSRSKKSSNTNAQFGLKDGGCPPGTVPIRRTREEDILRANSISSFGKKINSGENHYAMKRGKGKYVGTGAILNLWKPTVKHDDQFTASQFSIVNTTEPLNSVEGGWHVHPKLYGDSNPRLFVHWTVDNYKSTGCYNLLCSGFIQVSRTMPPGVVLQPISIYNGAQYEIIFLVTKDRRSGNWWLTVETETVGYWPSKLFNNVGLGESASEISWGGEVFVTSTDEPRNYPMMGSGSFGKEGYGKACYTKHMKGVTESQEGGHREFKDLDANIVVADKPNCYQVADFPDSEASKRPGLYFGGPGACS